MVGFSDIGLSREEVKIPEIVMGQGFQNYAFSPDGKTIASASDDNTVKWWNLDLDDLLAQACTWIGDYLNNNRYVSKEDKGLCDGVGSIKN